MALARWSLKKNVSYLQGCRFIDVFGRLEKREISLTDWKFARERKETEVKWSSGMEHEFIFMV